MNQEIPSFGFSSHRRPSAAQLQRISRGGKKANRLRGAREWHHHISEVPEAEKMLQESGNLWKADHQQTPRPEKIQNSPQGSFWKRILRFFSPQ